MRTGKDLGTTRALVMANASKVLVRSVDDEPLEASGQRPVVIVLGMHRSGTSLLSNILHYMGVDMADTSDKASPSNANGFWERPDLVALHDQVLEIIGRPIGSPLHALPFPSGWWRRRELQPLKLQIRDWLQRQLDEASGPWGFKDPRTCRLLPLWWEILRDLGVQARYVVAVRSPGEAATSMADKNPKARPLSVSQGELLWLAYNYDILRHVGGADPLIINYADWFRDPAPRAEALIRHLKLTPPFSQHELNDCLHGLIQPELQHNFEGKGRAESAFRISVPFYDAILQKSEMGPADEDPTLPHLSLLDIVFRCMRPVVDLVTELPRLREIARESTILGKRVTELEAALEDARTELLAVRHDAAVAIGGNKALQDRASTAEKALGKMQAALGPQRAGEHPLEDRFAAIGKIPLLTRLREIARETRILGEHAVEAEARLAKVPLEPPGGAHETAASSADHKILRDRAAAAERALEETRAELRTRRAAERRLEALVWALEAETESLTYRLSARSESRLALEGQVEGVEDGGLVGWAWYPLRMDRAAVVEVFVDGVFAAAALATEPRSENALLGKRGGRCGFAIPLEKLPLGGVGREVRVRAVGSAATLPGCPLRLRQDGTVETGSLDRSGAMPESDVPNGAGASSTMALDQAPARRHFRVAAANSV